MATELDGIVKKEFALFEGLPQLWTRETGGKIREKVEKVLGTMSEGSLLEIDAIGIEVFDVSFASELFAKLVLHIPIEYEGICIAVKGLNSYTEENLESALLRAGVMMLVVDGNEAWHLIGKSTGADATTIDALKHMEGPVSVQDLAHHLDIQPTACSERLSRLTQLGMVHRFSTESGRVQYRYSSIL